MKENYLNQLKKRKNDLQKQINNHQYIFKEALNLTSEMMYEFLNGTHKQ